MSAVFHKLRFAAHWLAPNFIPPPYKLDAERRFDHESDEASRVPIEEELQVRALWGVEIFGPNESQQLYTALRKLKWDRSFATEGEDALAWAKKQRSYYTGEGYDIGVVERAGQKNRFFGVSSKAEMPDGVDYALVRLHQICPTVTCVVVCFVLERETGNCYQEKLNSKRKGVFRRGKLGWITRFNPFHLKQEAVDAQRAELRQSIYNWFSRTIPGYFSNTGLSDSMPCAELISTVGNDIFTDQSRHLDWRRILANPSKYDIWENRGPTPLRFVDGRSNWPKELRNFLIVSASLPSSSKEMKGNNSANKIIHYSNERLGGILPYFAVTGFLKEISRELNLTREKLRITKSRSRTLRSITEIQKFFDKSAGVPSVVREICKSVERPSSLDYYIEEFTSPKWRETDGVRFFAEEQRKILHQTALKLLEDESSTREHFEQLASVLSIKESISAQRRMELLTVVALGVAALSLAAAWPEDWGEKIKSLNKKSQTLIEKIYTEDISGEIDPSVMAKEN
ncbi:hypothetical protein GCM10027276_44120 [Comamonas piscis]